MTNAQLIHENFKKALDEIGDIKPWFDQQINTWIYSHPSFPVQYKGDSAGEVMKKYPVSLKNFITELYE